VSPLLYGLEVNVLPEVVKIFSQRSNFVVFAHAFKIKSFINICMWIITHYKVCSYLFRHYNCQLSPLQLVQKVEITRGKHGDISMSNCFPSFIVRWILNFVDHHTHENQKKWYPTNKSDFTVLLFASNFGNFTSHWTE
jgi:hypothetical protein